ncbi:MAG TPA: RNA ligase family protein [Anaerovoracaceae bacterium]|nr:RNA ligase family protein [Anaerovoracaceae bacterium]
MTNVPGKGDRQAQYERRYKQRRHWLDSIKIASGCVDCQLTDPPECLTFDHVRGPKKFNIGQSWNQGRQALQEEIAKCEVVCANCHAIRTKKRSDDDPIFEPFPKIARLNRTCYITEKIDGTNATIWVDGEGDIWAGSRNRWITPSADNFGFAAWVAEHEDEFRELGPCVLNGEWWGSGIQRGYGLTKGEKRFTLFNAGRWNAGNVPSCVSVVPVLYEGLFTTQGVEHALEVLRSRGSLVAPGFMNPEGIVIYHTAANLYFKVTLEGDSVPKSLNGTK